MAGFRIEGNTSGNVVEVTSSSTTTEHPSALHVSLPLDDTLAGYATLTSEVDAGAITGTRVMRDLEVGLDYKLRTGVDTLVFNEVFPGTVLNSSVWTAPVATMTATVASGYATLNAGLSTASAAVARLSSYRGFPFFGSVQTYVELMLEFAQFPVANNVCEWGFGLAAGTAAPTDGAFFRLNASGEFRCVINYNGTEIQSNSLNFATLVGVNTTRSFIVSASPEQVEFWIDDALACTVKNPAAGFGTTATANLPVMLRTYNSNVTAAAQVMKLGMVSVTLGDLAHSKPFPHVAAGAGWNAFQAQTGAATVAQTAQWTNSANPTAAAPTNTTAALGTGLGGIFVGNINGLAVTTDWIISSYQVPAATAAMPGKTLYVTGVRFAAVNTVVANGAGPTTWAVGLAAGHTAVSLATSEGSAAKAPRRIPLGVQTLAAAAAVGATATNDVVHVFGTPVAVQPGEFVQTFIRFITNNSAATEAVQFVVGIEGYFE